MTTPSSAATQVRRTFAQHGPLIRAGQLFEAGVHPRTLAALRDAGDLELVSRGLYRQASAPVPDHLDLLVVAARAPHAVICLISALAFHDLTDEIPHHVAFALPRGAAVPRIAHPPTQAYHFAPAAYALGIEHHRRDGLDLKVYSPAKAIVDAFRFRNRIGEDVAIKALATGLRSRHVRPGALLELAAKVRARAVIEPYVKALA